MIRVLWRLLLSLIVYIPFTSANLLIPGIMTETVEIASNAQEFVGFLQLALNGTEVEIRVKCESEIDFDFGNHPSFYSIIG